MIIADRLRFLREEKHLSQGDIEQRTGLLRCYISRVENGHTVPAVETLEKMARALGVPMYQLFYDSDKPPEAPAIPFRRNGIESKLWGNGGAKEARELLKFRAVMTELEPHERELLLHLALKMRRQKNGD